MFDDRDLPELESAVGQDPRNATARLRLAEALLGLGQASGALVHARILLTSAPDDPVLLGLAAMAADLSGDPRSASSFGARMRGVQELSSPGGRSELRSAPTPIDGTLSPTLSLLGWRDVAGMAEERRRVTRELVDRWNAALSGGVLVTGGVLLYGPASTGKRFFVHVAAGECALPVFEVDLAASSDPWGEPDPASLASVFAGARANGPVVLLLANVEAVTHRRLRYTANGRRVLTELLAGLDSLAGTNVFAVATSSAPWLVQPVLRMPGRLLDAVLIGPPDRLARHHLVLGSLRRRGVASDIDVDAAADDMQGYTTDDIEAALDTAVARAYADSTKLGRVTRVQHAHLRTALASHPRRADAWFDSAYNFPEFTDDSAQFDPLFDYIRRHVRRS